ncbi:coiled-coil domain-containing protein 102A isoform X1 [Nomia melanderi]|uniref:coiled-coil domain-containing protein 102A isoform X1 n=2 Tax=Nomia melanderi TaxID=2448451 RepID=UPI0013044FB5|nr:coiled-coil domain-containing protein 102A isoform X1 [Nomia melanderi]
MAQSTASGTSSRRYMREHDVSVPSSSRYVDSEWETKEALRQRELEEARARAAQMEKTMRWWSDCTANWREKWSKVRNERNMAREEAKMLRAKLEIAVKDANSYKHECQELELQNEQLKKEMEKIHMILLKHAGQFDQQIFTVLESDPQLRSTLGIEELLKFYNNVERSESVNSQKDLLACKTSLEDSNICLGSHSILPDRDIEEYVLQGAVPKHAVELYKEGSIHSLDKDIARLVADSSSIEGNVEKHQASSQNDESFAQKILMLQYKLDEATKTISTEREEKNSLHRGMEKLRAEIIQLRKQCDDLEESKAKAMRELLELKDRFHTELGEAQSNLIDDASSRDSMNRRLSELRAELEKLQAENAAEWGKRERLETEKISLERENKQLRNELHDLQERIESRRSRPVSTSDSDTRQLQQELLVRNTILKKSLEEKTTELSHVMRRSEQYEAEVKRVRARVEELKKELAAAQDTVDSVTNSVRKLKQANEDLAEQLESANVQLEHFRNSTDSYMVELEENVEEKLCATNDGKLVDGYGSPKA